MVTMSKLKLYRHRKIDIFNFNSAADSKRPHGYYCVTFTVRSSTMEVAESGFTRKSTTRYHPQCNVVSERVRANTEVLYIGYQIDCGQSHYH